MSEITFETFRKAAQEAATNLDNPEERKERKKKGKSFKEEVSAELAKVNKEDVKEKESDTSKIVVDKIEKMIWPERELEIMRERARREVKKAAEDE